MRAHAVHVEFGRACDADDALGELAAHGFSGRVRRETSGLAITCAPEEDDAVLRDVSHALDDWLEERRLPFTPEQVGPATLVVRPPAD